MLKLYPDQLRAHLNGELSQVYFLMGNDPLLLQESQDEIRQIAFVRGFQDFYSVQINNDTDWKVISLLCQKRSLFTSRQMLVLILPDKYLSTEMNRKLLIVANFLYKDILLILRSNKLVAIQKIISIFNKKDVSTVLVYCKTPEYVQLPIWVFERACKKNLQIDKPSCQLLSYYYEGNLLALAQALDRLSILWPDRKLNLLRVKYAINDSSHFTALHWVDSLFNSDSKRAIHILQQLRLEGIEKVILLRTLQRELLFLITLKRQLKMLPLCTLLNKYSVWKIRRTIITKAIHRLTYNQICQAIYLLSRIELNFKKNYDCLLWIKLESLSLLLCHNVSIQMDIFTDDN